MKIVIIVIVIIVLIAIVLAVLTVLGKKPVSKENAIEKIQQMVEKEGGSALFYLSSATYDIEQKFIGGIQGTKPFHTASVGKTFTAASVAILVEQGKIKLDDLLINYLDRGILDQLFFYEGKDYRDEVTVRQLLNHTSGAADYFEDKTTGSPSLKELILSDKDRFWTPDDLLDFSRSYQKSVGVPGEAYHYSDTGYILLGLLIEKVSGQSYDQFLKEKIFLPLAMNDTYLMFYGEPVNNVQPIAPLFLDGVDIIDFQSLSIDWSGGGLITTAEDLSRFARAFFNYRIVTEETLDDFLQFEHKFMRGVHYGLGIMEFRFGEFFPGLGSLPHMRGHMGVTGTQMMYDGDSDTVIIVNLGSTDLVRNSVVLPIQVLSLLGRIPK